jgi:hypothetical protein
MTVTPALLQARTRGICQVWRLHMQIKLFIGQLMLCVIYIIITEYTSTAMLMVPSSTSPPNPNSTATSGGHAHRFQIHCLQMAQTQHHHRRFPGPFVNKVKRLNVTHDCDLSFEPHIKTITWTGFFHIHNISRLRPSLSHSITETLIHAFGPSRLDYCNTPYW